MIIDTQDLAEQLDSPDLILLDLRDDASYAAAHIPGAISFSLSEIVSTAPPIGGQLPSAEQFNQALSRVGYTEGKHIIAIDDNGGPQAARLVWTLVAFGIENASLIDGGMAAWLTENGQTENGINTPAPSQYQGILVGDNVADRDYVLQHLNDGHTQYLDARTPGEFNGDDLRSARGGHIPGAINFNWVQVKSPDMKFKTLSDIDAQLQAAGFNKDQPIVAYCQTHMRSSVIWVLLTQLGYQQAMGYPGAWSDWGNREDTPIE